MARPTLLARQIYAIILSYLVLFTHAEEYLDRVHYHQQVVLDQSYSDSDNSTTSSLVLEGLESCSDVDYTSTFAQLGDEIYHVVTKDGKTPCNTTLAEEMALEMLTPDLLHRQDGLNGTEIDTVFPLVFTLTALHPSIATATISLGAVGLGIIIGAVALLIASKLGLFDTKTETVEKTIPTDITNVTSANITHIPGTNITDVDLGTRNLSKLISPVNSTTDTCCFPPPEIIKHKIKISYADNGHHAHHLNHHHRKLDHRVAKSCIDHITNFKPSAGKGCCKVNEKHRGGKTRKYSLGASTDADDKFHCYQDK